MAFVSPFGKIDGVGLRLAEWIVHLKSGHTGAPWVGLGRLADLEVILRLLTLKEFGEWLRQQPDDELARWGVEVLEAAETVADHEALTDTIDENLPGSVDEPYDQIVERAGAVDTENTEIRTVLIEAGALAADDTDTPLPDLIKALLS